MTIEVYFDSHGIRNGKQGCYRARLIERPTIHDAGTTADDAVSNLLITAASFGLSGDVKNYTVVTPQGE